MYYKVVKQINDELFSCCIPYWKNFLGKKYIPGKWTVANKIAIQNGLGLMVFNSLTMAEQFNYRNSWEIWECKIKPFPKGIEIKPYGLSPNYYDIDDDFVELYEKCKKVDENGSPLYVLTIEWPLGTVFAKEVKLIKKVSSEISCDN